jgi:hypothetical protein
MTNKVTCGWCKHFFDPTDKRCYIPATPDPRCPPCCPCCTMERLAGDEAWAVWNACNGVFEVLFDRRGAVERLKEYPDGCRVIPVRIYETPESDWAFREWCWHNEHPDEEAA